MGTARVRCDGKECLEGGSSLKLLTTDQLEVIVIRPWGVCLGGLDNYMYQYRFNCPDCNETVVKNCEDRTAGLLFASDVAMIGIELTPDIYQPVGDVSMDTDSVMEAAGDLLDSIQSPGDIEWPPQKSH